MALPSVPLLATVPPSESVSTTISGHVREAIYLGATRKYIVALRSGQKAIARVDLASSRGHFAVGDAVVVAWDMADGIVVPDEPNADLAQDGAADGEQERDAQMARLASGGSRP